MDFFKKNQNAEGPDSDIDGNRVDIMFFKYFWCVRRLKDLTPQNI